MSGRAAAAFALAIMASVLPACTTTGPAGQNPGLPNPPIVTAPQGPAPSPDTDNGPAGHDGGNAEGSSPDQPTPQGPISDQGSNNDVATQLSEFDSLEGWGQVNALAALKAYRRACGIWAARDSETPLHEDAPHFGTLADWDSACFAADYASDSEQGSRRFFEQYFLPVTLSAGADEAGLLTGYYEPQIPVRSQPSSTYSEPILAKPASAQIQSLPRAQITAASAPVIAYGKPIDVFFMQVQGSGRIAFDDGRVMRAAFASHNGQTYKSIGAELVRRGAFTLEQASKQAIERWMIQNGPSATKALMNTNPRYIFFQAQEIIGNDGPKGSMGAPLEAMGTIAVDRAHTPYGALVFLETTLPQYGGDYKGAPSYLLVSAQDSGGAIKGPLRADLYFGAGAEAGDKAGVMKHPARWTLLLPAGLAMRYLALF